jgi:general secretion pathway protein I
MNVTPLNAGFSLIEVMVAILILGVALVGLTHGITTALESSKESEQQTTAALFAAGKIETLRAEGGLENGETDGDCGAGLEAYRWKQTISDADVDGLHDVDVVIERAQDNQEIYELKTLLFEVPSDVNDQNSNNKNSTDKNSHSKEKGNNTR